ncbi:MAG: hypothetical protein B7X48_08140 [Acidiphilium sp. 34-60-192]|nr:MAG: hypothetical protein B7X48_08140 [Acidiphilium sp. 34-60-192]
MAKKSINSGSAGSVSVASLSRKATNPHGVAPQTFLPDSMRPLSSYGLPENVRKLRNLVETALFENDGEH